MPSIKPWYFEICSWHSPHFVKLGTNVAVPLFQVLHRTLLELLVVILILNNYEAQIKSASEVKEVDSLCLSLCIIMKVELVVLL